MSKTESSSESEEESDSEDITKQMFSLFGHPAPRMHEAAVIPHPMLTLFDSDPKEIVVAASAGDHHIQVQKQGCLH